MNNYQLYRTNHLLSGQLKWDLIIKSDINTLCVSDFHLTPISDNAPYIYKTDEYLLNNTHQDNIKQFYHETQGNFYTECLNTEFIHNWPIICNENEIINAYSNIYDMGCRRSNKYDKYNKQFEFLCPLWIEHLTDVLSFKIEVKNIESNTVLGSNILSLDTKNIFNKYHNKFVDYFNAYIEAAKIDKGTDDIINIVFDSNTANITGLDVSNGLFKTKNIDTIISNITLMERPLMEVDNMLIQAFKDNKLICKQLFNFNICFNFEDIFSANVVKMLYGENVIISVTAFIGDEQLELRDFYTEYDFIKKQVHGDSTDYTENVLSYLKDNEYIGFINKNKFCQSICHWSLCENNDYIFNVYDGFSGLYIKNNNIYDNEHQYGNSPNITLTKYSDSHNSAGWINVKNIYTWNEFYKYIKNPEKYKYDGVYIGDSNYINNIKYKNIPFDKDNGIYVLGLNIKSNILSLILDKFKYASINSNGKVYVCRINDLLILLTSDLNNLTFVNFYNELHNMSFTDEEQDLKKIYQMLTSVVYPSLVILDNSLLYTTATNKILNSTEIEYAKNNNSFNYVLRYDGKIKPTFTTVNNTLYYKDYISEQKMNNSIYTKYNTFDFEPLYPSVNYCAIKKLKDWTYNELPYIQTTEHNTNISIYDNEYEYSWYNVSKGLVLNHKINFVYEKLNNDIKSLDEIVYDYISKYYKTTNTKLINYIKSLYSIENKWEYLSLTNIYDYKYDITLKLKSK